MTRKSSPAATHVGNEGIGRHTSKRASQRTPMTFWSQQSADTCPTGMHPAARAQDNISVTTIYHGFDFQTSPHGKHNLSQAILCKETCDQGLGQSTHHPQGALPQEGQAPPNQDQLWFWARPAETLAGTAFHNVITREVLFVQGTESMQQSSNAGICKHADNRPLWADHTS